MKFYKLSFLIGCIWVTSSTFLVAQSNEINYSLKKGEVLDLIFMTMESGSEKDLKNYLNQAVSVAQKYSYQTLPGLKISDYTAGNLNADLLVIGKWKTLERRKTFSNEILNHVPDFHEQRRKIWSHFGLTYYELTKDLDFTIDKSQYNVTTSYWVENTKSFKRALGQWTEKVVESGGQIRLTLAGGKSPFGYHYQPDFIIITAWKDEESFNNFRNKHRNMLNSKLNHINQFVHDLS